MRSEVTADVGPRPQLSYILVWMSTVEGFAML